MNISIIVPVYNTSKYVDRCMTALLEQDYPRDDYEIIAVDNGSSDDSRQRLGRYPVIVIDEPRRGSYAARNAGVRVSSGRLLAFTDSDCAPRPDWLRTIELVLALPERQVVQGQRVVTSESFLLQALNRYECAKDARVLSGDQRQKYYGYTNNMGMRREAYERYGPFIERDRGADTIFVRSVVDDESCAAVGYAPRMVIHHLEMNGFGDYLKKMFIYGRSRKRYRKIKQTRTLGMRERFSILGGVMEEGGYTSWQVAMLASGLGLSMVSWQLGSWAGLIETAGRSDT
ncbi:MAG: glycosyltransferase family 2 protein [Xanthomonadales bacterium]|nr:glycosyltransferase family 2 protein [Xanthomonadales bacterium]